MQNNEQEILQLRFENQHLRLENQQLQERCKQLEAEVAILKTQVKELLEKLNTNSSNSSKPPSQDPFRKPRKKNKTGRKQGGQPGHSGHERKLYPLDQVQMIHDLKPTECPNCRFTSFSKEIVSTDVRQVVELPDAPPQVTQYNIHTCQCGHCGKHVKAGIPTEAQFGFGPRLMGLITFLSGEFRLSKRQVVTLVGKIGVRICSGSVCKIHVRASKILEKPYEEIKQYTLQQAHLHADETSWRTLGKKRWTWIACGKDSTYFKITSSRSAQAFQEVFDGFKGGLTTDRYSAYNSHEGPQQLCWAHADRDFEKIAERDGFDKIIGERLKECKTVTFALWHEFKSGLITRTELIRRVEVGPKEDLRVLLKAGAIHEDCHTKTKATCIDFFIRFDKLWLFVYAEGVEPTNNVAERGLRHKVIWRKLSFGSQSEVGERFVERVMTVAATLKQQAKNSFEYFTKCFREYIRGGQSPPIFV